MKRYNERQRNHLYQSVMEAKVQAALEEARVREKIDLISKNLAKGMSVEEIADLLEESVETIQNLMKAI